VIRASALQQRSPYNERWFMYVEDVDLCWSLRQLGWRIRLQPDVQVPHVGNASGELAWGEGRSARWWAATYDWYRLRHGPAAARRWAALNTVSVGLLLSSARVQRKIRGAKTSDALKFRIGSLRQALPLHSQMLRAPKTAFATDVAGADTGS
jgi:GT2 family glycosyltransferase